MLFPPPGRSPSQHSRTLPQSTVSAAYNYPASTAAGAAGPGPAGAVDAAGAAGALSSGALTPALPLSIVGSGLDPWGPSAASGDDVTPAPVLFSHHLHGRGPEFGHEAGGQWHGQLGGVTVSSAGAGVAPPAQAALTTGAAAAAAAGAGVGMGTDKGMGSDKGLPPRPQPFVRTPPSQSHALKPQPQPLLQPQSQAQPYQSQTQAQAQALPAQRSQQGPGGYGSSHGQGQGLGQRLGQGQGLSDGGPMSASSSSSAFSFLAARPGASAAAASSAASASSSAAASSAAMLGAGASGEMRGSGSGSGSGGHSGVQGVGQGAFSPLVLPRSSSGGSFGSGSVGSGSIGSGGGGGGGGGGGFRGIDSGGSDGSGSGGVQSMRVRRLGRTPTSAGAGGPTSATGFGPPYTTTASAAATTNAALVPPAAASSTVLSPGSGPLSAVGSGRSGASVSFGPTAQLYFYDSNGGVGGVLTPSAAAVGGLTDSTTSSSDYDDGAGSIGSGGGSMGGTGGGAGSRAGSGTGSGVGGKRGSLRHKARAHTRPPLAPAGLSPVAGFTGSSPAPGTGAGPKAGANGAGGAGGGMPGFDRIMSLAPPAEDVWAPSRVTHTPAPASALAPAPAPAAAATSTPAAATGTGASAAPSDAGAGNGTNVGSDKKPGELVLVLHNIVPGDEGMSSSSPAHHHHHNHHHHLHNHIHINGGGRTRSKDGGGDIGDNGDDDGGDDGDGSGGDGVEDDNDDDDDDDTPSVARGRARFRSSGNGSNSGSGSGRLRAASSSPIGSGLGSGGTGSGRGSGPGRGGFRRGGQAWRGGEGNYATPLSAAASAAAASASGSGSGSGSGAAGAGAGAGRHSHSSQHQQHQQQPPKPPASVAGMSTAALSTAGTATVVGSAVVGAADRSRALAARRAQLAMEEEAQEKEEEVTLAYFKHLAERALGEVTGGHTRYTRMLSLAGRHSFCSAADVYNLIMTPHDSLLRAHMVRPLLRIIDCRRKDEYLAGHIRGALHLSECTTGAAKRALNSTPLFEQRAAALDPRNAIVFYGAEEVDTSSAAAGTAQGGTAAAAGAGAAAGDGGAGATGAGQGGDKGRRPKYTRLHAKIVQVVAMVDDGVSRLLTLRGGYAGFKKLFPFLVCTVPHDVVPEGEGRVSGESGHNGLAAGGIGVVGYESSSESFETSSVGSWQSLTNLPVEYHHTAQHQQQQQQAAAGEGDRRKSPHHRRQRSRVPATATDALASLPSSAASPAFHSSFASGPSGGYGGFSPGRDPPRRSAAAAAAATAAVLSRRNGLTADQQRYGVGYRGPPISAALALGALAPVRGKNVVFTCPFWIPRSEGAYVRMLKQYHREAGGDDEDAAAWGAHGGAGAGGRTGAGAGRAETEVGWVDATAEDGGALRNGHRVPGTAADEFDADLNVYPNLILEPWLFLGDQRCSWSLAALLDLQITHIINISTDICNYFEDHPAARLANGKAIKYLTIRMHDDQNSDILSQFNLVFNFIDMAKKSDAGARIMVHCQMGISRSASLIIAYIMHLTRLSLKDTYYHVKMRRYIIHPNRGFWAQLGVVEKQLCGGTTTVYDIMEAGMRKEVPEGCRCCTIA